MRGKSGDTAIIGGDNIIDDDNTVGGDNNGGSFKCGSTIFLKGSLIIERKYKKFYLYKVPERL